MSGLREAEERLIAIWLDKPETVEQTGLSHIHFNFPDTRKVAEAILHNQQQALPVDPVSVALTLERWGVKQIGGSELTAYLLKLEREPTQSSVMYWAEKVKESYESKRVLEIAENITRAVKKGVGIADIAASASEAFSRSSVKAEEGYNLQSHLLEEIKNIDGDLQRIRNGEKVLVGLNLGLGLHRVVPGGGPLGVVMVLCGDVGVGKSTLLQNFVDNISRSGVSCVVFSLEDSAELYRQRALARISGVPFTDIATRNVNTKQLKQMAQIGAEDQRATERVYIEDVGGLTVDQVIRRYRELRLADPAIGFIAVDYLQLLAGEPDRNTRLENAMRKLQAAAKQDKILALAVSQLNREGVKGRKNPRPRRHDLYGSGSIEQYSKLIVGAYRPARYDIPPPEGYDAETWQRVVQIWILKNVRGEDEIFLECEWDPQTGRIWEIEHN